MNFYSHPNKLLYQHHKEVRDYIGRFCPKDSFLHIVAVTHDFGKYTTFFQNWLLYGIGGGERRTFHSFLSAVFTYYILKEKGYPVSECILGYMLVYNHHGYIRSIKNMFAGETVLIQDGSVNLKVLQEQIADLEKHKGVIEAEYKKLGLDFRFEDFAGWILEQGETDLLRISELFFDLYRRHVVRNLEFYHRKFLDYFALLVQGDSYSASDLNFELRKNFIKADDLESYLRQMGNGSLPLNSIRSMIRLSALEQLEKVDVSKERIFFINAFTGSGKTLTSLSVALALKDKKEKIGCRQVKIVYCLPFVNIIVQTYEVFKDILGKFIPPKEFADYESHYLLQHFYLSDGLYKDRERQNLEPIENKLIIDNFESNLIITTFVQLLNNTLYSNQNSSISKLAGLRDSIIVIDEVQAFPIEFWKLIEKILEFWADTLNIHFILMTATKPILFENRAVTLVEAGFELLPSARVRLYYDPTPRTVEEFAEWFIRNDYEKNNINSYLIVLNTIQSAKELFKALKRKAREAKLFHISNNITAVEKAMRLQKAKEALKRGERVIVVSTQVIEAGVDISFERSYRDTAILDSLLQTAGRINRNGEGKIGDIFVINLVYRTKKGDLWSYAEMVYSSIHLDETRSVLKKFLTGKTFLTDKEDFDDMIEEYFQSLRQRYYDLTKENEEVLWNAYLEFDAKKMREFRLIKDEADKVTLFIELNEEARRIFADYKEKVLNEKDFLKRQNEFLKIRKDLNKYIVNVYESKLDRLAIGKYMDMIKKHSQGKDDTEPEILAVPYDIIKEVYDLGTDPIDASLNIFCDGEGLL